MHATREMKVGLFVFVAFVLLAIIIFSISDFYGFSPGYELNVFLKSASGIDVGAPVRLAGVAVGEVRKVTVSVDEAEATTRAELVVWVKDAAKIEEDAVAYVNTSGLIGDRYLEIVPGTRGARLLTAHEVVRGRETVAMSQFLDTGYDTIARLNKAIAAVQSIVGDEETRAALKGTVTNSQEVTAELREFLHNANAVMLTLRNGQGTIGRLLVEDTIYQDLEATAKDIRAHPWKLFHRPRDAKP